MNDNAIEKRTKLRLEDEAERKMQLMEDLKLEKRLERSEKGQRKQCCFLFLLKWIFFFEL